MTKTNNKVLIIDSYNLFIRSYVVDPSLDMNGNPIGGCKGYLKSLQKFVRQIKPSKIIAVWDGDGGSSRRRTLIKDYKRGRRACGHLNRAYNLTDVEETESKIEQLSRTIEYLNLMPVIQLMIDSVEADDVIAKICQMQELKDCIKIILSSDKDFIQLCSEDTILLRPTQDEILNTYRVVEKYGIHPNNYALARAISGDKSDNIRGIRGGGLKTIAKRFPFLSESKFYSIDELVQYAKVEKENKPLKIYEEVIKSRKNIETNYRAIQLYSSNIPSRNSEFIRNTITEFSPTFNKTGVVKLMINDGMTDFNWQNLFQHFRLLASS